MLETSILGASQGIAEWLPVSSSGVIVLIKEYFFSDGSHLSDILKFALFLHLGTFLAALVYFWKDLSKLISNCVNYRSADPDSKRLVNFYATATMITGGIGFGILYFLDSIEDSFTLTSKTITFAIGIMLVVTGLIQLKRKIHGHRRIHDLKIKDAIVVGLIQGFALLPGLSRSGLTISTLLFRRVDTVLALHLSFIMSLPVVLGGNIILNLADFTFKSEYLVGFFASFVFGILTIHMLLHFARRIKFGLFVFIFGLLTIISSFFINGS